MLQLNARTNIHHGTFINSCRNCMWIVSSVMYSKGQRHKMNNKDDYNNISGKIMSLHISYILAIKIKTSKFWHHHHSKQLLFYCSQHTDELVYILSGVNCSYMAGMQVVLVAGVVVHWLQGCSTANTINTSKWIIIKWNLPNGWFRTFGGVFHEETTRPEICMYIAKQIEYFSHRAKQSVLELPKIHWWIFVCCIATQPDVVRATFWNCAKEVM